MTVTNGYPAAPMSTTVAAPTSTTQQLAYDAMHIFNEDVEVIEISKARTPALSTIKAIGRGLSGGEFGDVESSLTEELFTDYPEHKWKEQDMFKEEFTPGATHAASTGVTTIKFVTTSGLVAGNILRVVRTQEQVRVQSVTNATDVVVVRDIAGTSLGTIIPTDVVVVLSTATVGGQIAVSAIGRGMVDKSNYYQKFLTTVTLNDEELLRLKLGGKNFMDNLMREKYMIHALEQEKQLVFGAKSTGVDVDGKTFRTMEGIINFAQRGWTDNISSSLTRETLEAALAKPLKYTKNGNMKKIAFCGANVKPKLSSLFESRLQVSQINTIDLGFSSIKTGIGEYVFIEHPMLDSNSWYANSIVIVDLEYIKLCYPKSTSGNLPWSGMAGFDGKTRFEINSTATDWANASGSIVTYMSLEASNSNSAGVITIL